MYGKMPESEFVEDKGSSAVTFIATKNMKEDYLKTKINFNDKKEDGVIPEQHVGKGQKKQACKVLCLHLCANSAEINNEIEEAA